MNFETPVEKGKINPLAQRHVLKLTQKLNSSVNMSINASRRNLMQNRATRNIGKSFDKDSAVKKRLEDLQKLRMDSLKKQDRYIENRSEMGDKRVSNISKSQRSKK